VKHAARTPGRTAEAGRSRLTAQLPYAVVLAGVIAGLAIIRDGGHGVRGGTLVMAGALLAGSVIRVVLPDGRAGLLRSRQRLADCAVLAVLGGGLLVAGLIVRIPG
jgi:hypothetical protein